MLYKDKANINHRNKEEYDSNLKELADLVRGAEKIVMESHSYRSSFLVMLKEVKGHIRHIIIVISQKGIINRIVLQKNESADA